MRLLRWVSTRALRVVPEACCVPRGWGFAYDDPARDGIYAAPIPLNVLIFVAVTVYRWLVNPMRVTGICARCGRVNRRRWLR